MDFRDWEPVQFSRGEIIHAIGFWLVGLVTFFGVWAVCWATYGTKGALLGWLPALLIAYIAGWLWPVAIVLAAVWFMVT